MICIAGTAFICPKLLSCSTEGTLSFQRVPPMFFGTRTKVKRAQPIFLDFFLN